jgi:FixJ family two-component response regulator
MGDASMSDLRPVVWVVDDDASVRRGLARLLSSAALTVETFATGTEFLARPNPERHGCLLLDLSLPDTTGLELQQLLHGLGEGVPVVFISGEADVTSGVRAMREGAVDFLTKPLDSAELLGAVTRALAKDAEQRERRAALERAAQQIAALTPREREVFGLVALGKPNKRIAAELGISEKTTKVHRGRVMHKLGAESVVDLVHLAEKTL